MDSIMEQYLLDKVKMRMTERKETVLEVNTKELFLKRQLQLKEEFKSRVIGKLKHSCEQRETKCGLMEFKGKGYIIEKIILEPENGYIITCNFYLPDSIQGKIPGVLVLVGHNNEGKSNREYQIMCANLAIMGFGALVFDPWGQGERDMYPTEVERDIYPTEVERDIYHTKVLRDVYPSEVDRLNCVIQHSMAGNLCYLLGENFNVFYTQDCIYALDYLCSRPEIDSNRIGCTGQSGGGTATVFTAALDNRIKVLAPTHCLSTYVDMLTDLKQSGDPDQSVFNLISGNFDMQDLIWMAAPRPVLINAAVKDFFPIRGNRKIYDEAKKYYSFFGAEDRLSLAEVDCGHEIIKEVRENVYRWMKRWLMPDNNDDSTGSCLISEEQDIEIQTEEGLSCLSEFGNNEYEMQDPFEICKRKMYQYRESRELGKSKLFAMTHKEYRETIKNMLKSVLGQKLEEHEAFKAEEVCNTSCNDYCSEKIIISTTDKSSTYNISKYNLSTENLSLENLYTDNISTDSLYTDNISTDSLSTENLSSDNLSTECYLYTNKRRSKSPLLIFIDFEESLFNESRVKDYISRGINVARIIPGGTESSITSNIMDIAKYSRDHQLAYYSFILGENLISKRLNDCIKAIEYLRNRSDLKDNIFVLAGSGQGAIIAMIIGAVFAQIDALILADFTALYEMFFHDRNYRILPTSIIFGILKQLDLDMIAAAFAKKPMLMLDVRDGKNLVISDLSRLREIFEYLLGVYGKVGAEQAIEFKVSNSEEDKISYLMEHVRRFITN